MTPIFGYRHDSYTGSDDPADREAPIYERCRHCHRDLDYCRDAPCHGRVTAENAAGGRHDCPDCRCA